MFIKKLSARFFDLEFKLVLTDNIVLISGDSGTGKTLLFEAIRAKNDASIMCYNNGNRQDLAENILHSRLKDRLIVIDNADIILDMQLRAKIAFDRNNQYIIIGRNPCGYHLALKGMAELVIENRVGKLKYTYAKSK